MGKRYKCDYCDKTMVSAPSIIRTHVKGTVHQKMVNEHYQQYKDPETILNEESTKRPCNRFLQGNCGFGAICKYSHYTPDQIDALREYVAAKNNVADASQPSFEDLYQRLQSEKSTKSTSSDELNTVIYDKCGVTHVLPWTYNCLLDEYEELPPSIRRWNFDNFVNGSLMEWGWK